MRAFRSLPTVLLVVVLAGLPRAAEACAVCFGKTDSPLGKGFQWGVLVLLGFILAMLSVISVLAWLLARRTRMLEAAELNDSNDSLASVEDRTLS